MKEKSSKATGKSHSDQGSQNAKSSRLVPQMSRTNAHPRPFRSPREYVLASFLCIVMAVTAALFLNIVLSLTGLVNSSETYQEVATRQYSVAFARGLLLYGLLYPLLEEVIFRGIFFALLRRWIPWVAAALISAVLFGIYHGNIVQGIYAACVGFLLAYLYERLGSFWFPFLGHCSANLVVYCISNSAAAVNALFRVWVCAPLFVLFAAALVIEEHWVRSKRNASETAIFHRNV